MKNYSKQRELILSIMKNNKSHPIADEIYELAILQNPTISKSTVYRNINQLVEENILLKINTKSQSDRFDYIHQSHYHFICNKCHKVYDIHYKFDIEDISQEIKKQIELDVEINDITLNGICRDCKK